MLKVSAIIGGKLVQGTHTDCGIVTTLDDDGVAYEAYKDVWVFGDKRIESFVDVNLLELNKEHGASFRMAEALTWLEQAGITELRLD